MIRTQTKWSASATRRWASHCIWPGPSAPSRSALTCHSVPSVAPPTLVARYGSDNGYGWQPSEIVGAQVVSVPFASATANAEQGISRIHGLHDRGICRGVRGL